MLPDLSDLDRCEHGRHIHDNCIGCGGPSHGNPYLAEGQRIGTSLYGAPITAPAMAERHIRSEWLTPGEICPHGMLLRPAEPGQEYRAHENWTRCLRTPLP